MMHCNEDFVASNYWQYKSHLKADIACNLVCDWLVIIGLVLNIR